jgi:hypothetical protein
VGSFWLSLGVFLKKRLKLVELLRGYYAVLDVKFPIKYRNLLIFNYLWCFYLCRSNFRMPFVAFLFVIQKEPCRLVYSKRNDEIPSE